MNGLYGNLFFLTKSRTITVVLILLSQVLAFVNFEMWEKKPMVDHIFLVTDVAGSTEWKSPFLQQGEKRLKHLDYVSTLLVWMEEKIFSQIKLSIHKHLLNC